MLEDRTPGAAGLDLEGNEGVLPGKLGGAGGPLAGGAGGGAGR